jgi:hypothetical protein
MFLPWRDSPSGPRPYRYREFTITLRHKTLGRIPLDEWSARRRDLYLTTLTADRQPCPRQSQQASGRKPTPYTARPLGSAHNNVDQSKNAEVCN